jgi:cbb3-type cytochrome oxidase subunit 3
MSEGVRRFASAVVTVIFVLAGLYAGNLWLFHGWAANFSGPHADWYREWSAAFLVAMCVCFIAAIAWSTRRRWWR